MKKLMLTVAGAALGIGLALPGQAQTLDADCQKMFETADVNKDGSLGAGESDKFVVLMSTKPKDAAIVTMDEFMAECRKDAFKGMQEAAVTPDTNTAAKTSSDATATTAEQPAATAEQPAATTEQPAATAEQPAATAEQPAATAEQPAATAEQPAATAEQPAASAEQPAASAEQPAATAEQPAVTAEQPAATAEQPAATATAEQPAATGQALGNMLASKLIGTTVVSVDNRNIGEINDIVIDVENQEAAQAIIGVGGFLGIGEKNVAVELKRLDVRADLETNAWTVVLDTTEEELKQLPEYKAAAN